MEAKEENRKTAEGPSGAVSTREYVKLINARAYGRPAAEAGERWRVPGMAEVKGNGKLDEKIAKTNGRRRKRINERTKARRRSRSLQKMGFHEVYG